MDFFEFLLRAMEPIGNIDASQIEAPKLREQLLMR